MIALCCDIPGTVETMNIETDSDVLEMFGLHRRNGRINVYVRQVCDDVQENLNENAGNGNNIDGNGNIMGLNFNNLGPNVNNDEKNNIGIHGNKWWVLTSIRGGGEQ